MQRRALGSVGRDRGLEADLLTTVDRIGPTPHAYGFGASVQSRLDRGDRLHGNAFAARDVRDLLGEAIEEAEDLPAWAVLAFTQAVRSGADQSSLDTLRQAIVMAACAAATAHLKLREAVAAWERAGR